jgi:hypothetical protein
MKWLRFLEKKKTVKQTPKVKYQANKLTHERNLKQEFTCS